MVSVSRGAAGTRSRRTTRGTCSPRGGVDGRAVRLAALVDPVFLTEAGWDPAGRCCPRRRPSAAGPPGLPGGGMLDHGTDPGPGLRRLPASAGRHGLGEDEVALLPARTSRRAARAACAVTDCAREWVSSRALLCRAHLDQQPHAGARRGAAARHPLARPLAACGPCGVAACPQQRRHRDGVYCEAHQQRLREARRDDPGFDEQRWRATEPAVGRGGEVSLRGLPALVIAEVLFGSAAAQPPRRGQDQGGRAAGVLQRAAPPAGGHARRLRAGRGPRWLLPGVGQLGDHPRARALSTPETEIAKDEWDLVVFGHSGTLSFTEITQPLAARGRQTVGRRRPAPTPVRPGGAPAAAWPCAITSAAWPGCRSPCGCAPTAARSPPRWAAPTWKRSCNRLAYLQGERADQRRCPDPGLPRGPRRAHPRPGHGPDPPRRAGGRAWARTSPSAWPTSPPSPSRPSPAGTSPGDHAADLRAPGRADLPGDAHRHRAGHRHRPTPRGDLHPGASTAWPATTTGRRCWSTTTTKPTGSAAACRSASTPPR